MSEQDWIAELAREAVEIVAPQELPLFRGYSEGFFRDPKKTLAEKSRKDDLLGFGQGELVEILTGPALTLAAVAWAILADAARDALKSKSKDSIGALIDRVLKLIGKGPKAPKAAPEWTWRPTPDEFRQLREILLEAARRLKVSDAKAALLADAVIARIAERRR